MENEKIEELGLKPEETGLKPEEMQQGDRDAAVEAFFAKKRAQVEGREEVSGAERMGDEGRAWWMGLLSGALEGESKGVMKVGTGVMGGAMGEAIKVGKAVQIPAQLAGYDGLHKYLTGLQQDWEKWRENEYGLGYEDWGTALGDVGAKAGEIAGSMGVMRAEGKAAAPIAGLSAFADTWQLARDRGHGWGRALTEAGASGMIHFLGFKAFESKSLSKLFKIPELQGTRAAKLVEEAAKGGEKGGFSELVRSVRNGSIAEVLLDRAKGALRAGSVIGVQEAAGKMVEQVADMDTRSLEDLSDEELADKLQQWKDYEERKPGALAPAEGRDAFEMLGESLKAGLQGFAEGAAMEGVMGAGELALTAAEAREQTAIAVKKLLADPRGRGWIGARNPEAMALVQQVALDGGKATPELLDAAGLPPDMAARDVRRLAHDLKRDVETAERRKEMETEEYRNRAELAERIVEARERGEEYEFETEEQKAEAERALEEREERLGEESADAGVAVAQRMADTMFGEGAGVLVRRGTAEEAGKAAKAALGEGADEKALKDAEGNTFGWWNRKKGEIVLFRGADWDTVSHELGWHATRQWAERNSPELLARMNDYANSAPEWLKEEIKKLYPDFKGDDLLDEIGAARFEREMGADFMERMMAEPEARTWWQNMKAMVKEAWTGMVNAIAGRGETEGIDFAEMEGMAPERAMEWFYGKLAEGRGLGGEFGFGGQAASRSAEAGGAAQGGAGQIRPQIRGIFTGTGADYANRSREGGKDDGPSLKKIGTGEGSQVYGWGLYGSNQRGVAERYARVQSGNLIGLRRNGERIKKPDSKTPQGYAEIKLASNRGDVESAIKELEKERDQYRKVAAKGNAFGELAKQCKEAAEYIRKHGKEYETIATGNLYEQTFFTDRAPGDESHLLKWYEPVSEENVKRVLEQYAKEHDGADLRADTPSGTITLEDFGDRKLFADALKENADALKEDGASLYRYVSGVLGSEQAASEFLARAGIDGVKYPVDSYGGKTLKDGDAAGWNYVSFRDDNIRVDHKWTDGQQRYSIVAQTETPQFKNFFGDWEKDPENASKVVDKDGKPLVVWHGDMDPSFTVFDKGQIRRGHGFWFAKDQGEAASYALDAEPRAFFLNIRNPAREADMKGRLLDDYHANGGAGASWKAFIWDRHASEFLRSRGYDGLEFEGKYIAFEPTQIKSATDNTGAFSPTNPDIRYSIVSLGGRDVAVAETEPLTTAEAQDEAKVREVLSGVVGREFQQLGEAVPVAVDKDMPDEFWSSAYSQMVRRKHERLWRAKVSAVPILGEMLQTTPLGPAEAARHINRDFKDRATFYRCQSEFGIKRWDGVAVYPCELLLLEVDGVRYVYDIVNMKKPTLTAKGGLDEATLRRLYDGGTHAGESATSVPEEGTARNIPDPAEEVKGDPEGFARRSVVMRATDGDADEKESALVAFVAERALRHGPKPNAIKTIGRLGLEMGLKTVDTKRIIEKGEALAERVRGTVIERAVRSGDVATATALLARESDIDRLVAGAAGAGGRLAREGEGKMKTILDREIERTVRSFNAATLADVERDTGIDIAEEILANSPERFDPRSAARDAAGRGGEDAGETGEGGEGPASGERAEGPALSDAEMARRQRIRREAEERVAKLVATAKERAEKAKAEREEWQKRQEQRRRLAEEAEGRDAEREAAMEGEDGGGDDGGGAPGGAGAAEDVLKLSTFADFKTPEEFAAFFRVWAEDRYKKEHGASTLGKHEGNRLFPEFYRKAAVRELQDLADKLLSPKGARAAVNRWLGELQPGVKPDTLERVTADIFAFINRNAIRESRSALVRRFRRELKPFAKGARFDDLKQDADRKVSGWVEEAARYVMRVCELSDRAINGEPSALERERERLEEILGRREKVYDDEGKSAADAPKFDMETRRALAKLQLLEKYGAMRRLMPGEIEDLTVEAVRWLNDEAGRLEDAWRGAREAEDSIRGALTGAIVGPGGQRYRPGTGAGAWFDRLFDSLNGMIRLRLQHLVRFAPSASRQRAEEAINRVVVLLGDGEVAFNRQLQDDRAAFRSALEGIFRTPDGKGVDRAAVRDWLNRMTEDIPRDLSRRLSRQGYAEGMTYGQMLQLLVSLEQKSYAEAVKANKRDGQANLIRTFETVGPDGRRERVLTDKDILFIDWLRSFYEAKRGMLSEVTKRMTGLPVDSPDPLYCPVKMYMGDQARGMHADSSRAWDPIGAVFSRRVDTLRDFDESASILGQFFDRSAASANLVAWGERGSIIRGVFTSRSVQESIRRAFGGGELTKILRQLEETFNGGESIRKAPGEIAAADKAMNWMTYLSLGYNPLSAAKQTTSFTVWANALPGGFSDLWRYMTDVDMATIKHIKESEAYKVRYGNEVGSGHDVASKGLFENPSENPVAAFFRKTSMGLLRKGDFLPGGWIAQGVFRDLYNRHLKEGMDADAADRLAMTETFNMLEETQQSGRTYNTSELAREHGRLGRLLVQFATSPLQQLQYETQAAREVRDLARYRPSAPDADFERRFSEAKGRLVRAVVINHVLLPAALHAVTSLYRLAMGYDPEWEQEGWHWTLLRDIVAGQFSRVFFLGAISSVTTDVLISGKPVRDVPALIPAEGVVKLFGNVAVTARDVATLDYERVQKDLDRLLKSTSLTRTPYDVARLVTGRAYADREERREKRRKKEARK